MKKKLTIFAVVAMSAMISACGVNQPGTESEMPETSVAELISLATSETMAPLVAEPALDLSPAVVKTTADSLLDHASPKTSAMTLFTYDGKTVRNSFLYDAEKEQAILDALNAVKAVKVDNWKVEDATLPIYGIEIGREDGWSILAAWSNGYWFAQDGAVYRFDYDFESLAKKEPWENEGELPSFTSFPCARLFTQEGDGWNTKLMVPAAPLNPPKGITMTLDAFEGDNVVVLVSNKSSEDWRFGEFYEIQVSLGGKWYEVPSMPGNWAFNCMGYYLPAGKSQTMTHHLSMYGELPSGKYRIVLNGLSTEYTIP